MASWSALIIVDSLSSAEQVARKPMKKQVIGGHIQQSNMHGNSQLQQLSILQCRRCIFI